MANLKEKLETLRVSMSKILLNLSEVKTEEGVTVVYEGELIPGETKLFVYDEAGEQIPAPNGEYTIEGVKYTVTDGVIEVPAEEAPVEEEAAIEEAPTTEEIVEDIPAEPAVDVIVEEIVDAVEEVAEVDQIDPVQALADIVTKLVEKLDAMEKEMVNMNKDITLFKDRPAGEPIVDVYKKSVMVNIKDLKNLK